MDLPMDLPIKRNTIPKVIALILTLMISSCMTFSLEGDGQKTPDSKTKQETVHGSLYKIQWSNSDDESWSDEKCDNNVSLKRVEFHTNAIYLIVSVATFGVYVPQTVTWWCVGEKPADDPDDPIYVPEI